MGCTATRETIQGRWSVVMADEADIAIVRDAGFAI